MVDGARRAVAAQSMRLLPGTHHTIETGYAPTSSSSNSNRDGGNAAVSASRSSQARRSRRDRYVASHGAGNGVLRCMRECVCLVMVTMYYEPAVCGSSWRGAGIQADPTVVPWGGAASSASLATSELAKGVTTYSKKNTHNPATNAKRRFTAAPQAC